MATLLMKLCAVHGSLSVLIVATSASATSAALPDKPNIVLVLTDDEDLLLGGASNRPLPAAADALSSAGATFANHFVHTPVRTPSRRGQNSITQPRQGPIVLTYTDSAHAAPCSGQACLSVATFATTLLDSGQHAVGCLGSPSCSRTRLMLLKSDEMLPSLRCQHHLITTRRVATHPQVCCPSRSEILSGRYFHNLMWDPPSDRWDTVDGVHSRQCMHIDESKLSPGPTFAAHLADVGYKVHSG